MKIGLACSHDFSPALGVSRVVRGIQYGLARTLKGRSLSFYGMSIEAREELTSKITLAGIKVREGGAAMRIGGYRVLWEQSKLPRHCALDRIDLLHAPAYIAPVLSRVPVVLTVHDVLSRTHPALCRRRNVLHHRLLLERSLQLSRRIITVSDFVRSEILRTFDIQSERVQTIHPGVDVEFIEHVSCEAMRRVRAKHRLPRRYLLWTGNQEPKKNTPILAKAMKLLREAGCTMPLVMAGSPGWGSQPLDFEYSMSIGWVSQSDMPALYASADALVFPSLAEGWGMPVAEAMACGTPVVCSPVPAALEIDRTCPVIIDPYSPANIAEGILHVLDDPEGASERARRGQKHAHRMTWEHHASQLWHAYAEVLSQ